MEMTKRLVLTLVLVAPLGSSSLPAHYHSCTFNFTGGARLPYPFCNVSLPLEERLTDLLRRMTYQEKTAALDTSNPAVERLGLPSMKGGESTHGVASGCGTAVPGSTGCPTSFPTGPGLGASFDRSLWDLVGSTIGTEARALNNQGGAKELGDVPGLPTGGPSGIYFLDPNINLIRDPRWGRCQEVPGEDPFLTSEYAASLISATQRGPRDVGDGRFLAAAATAKHFSMYDSEGYIPRTDPQPPPASGSCATPGGCERWNFDMKPPLRDLVDFYLPPFASAVQRARVASIMCSYNMAFGLPTCADDSMNNGVVREQWGFDGFFVSDCTALELMGGSKWDGCQHPWPSEGGSCTPDPFTGASNYTHTLADTMHAALVQGGIDYNCGALYRTNLYPQLEAGAVKNTDVDKAAGRIYKTMLRLGMLDITSDQPLITQLGPADVDSASTRAAALRAARESIVLLKNKGRLLPLSRSASVAFIGPHANSTQSLLGNYHGSNKLVDSHSPFLAALSAGVHVSYSLGCQICDYPYGKNPGFPNNPCPVGKDQNSSGIPAAVEAAKAADVAVLFVGLDQTSEAENFDRTNLTLPGVQEDLINQVLAAQPNTVVVLIHGGPIASEAVKRTPAVLDAFYPGELGGDAIVDVLFGDYNPAGRMPYTVYHANYTQRDIRVTDLKVDGGTTYRWFDGPVQWPFGSGLSYTNFSFEWETSAVSVRRPQHTFGNAEEIIDHSVIVTNTGDRSGDVVVTAFVNAVNVSADAPRRRLFGFERLRNMTPGEKRKVLFTTSVETLAFADEFGRRILAPGVFSVEVGDLVTPARHDFEVVLDATLDGDILVLAENKWARELLERSPGSGYASLAPEVYV